MLGIFGQPREYSDVLTRIFVATFSAGLGCSVLLYFQIRPEKSIDFKFELEVISPLWLLVLFPFLVAVFSRILKLHDQISTFLGIRKRFDVNEILVPLAEGTKFDIGTRERLTIAAKRHSLMKRAFYKYVPDADNAKINRQYVQDALDKWAWFWCCVEPAAVILIGGVIALCLGRWQLALVFLVFAIALSLLAPILYLGCKRAAQRQVEDILDDSEREADVHGVFSEIFRRPT